MSDAYDRAVKLMYNTIPDNAFDPCETDSDTYDLIIGPAIDAVEDAVNELAENLELPFAQALLICFATVIDRNS